MSEVFFYLWCYFVFFISLLYYWVPNVTDYRLVWEKRMVFQKTLKLKKLLILVYDGNLSFGIYLGFKIFPIRIVQIDIKKNYGSWIYSHNVTKNAKALLQQWLLICRRISYLYYLNVVLHTILYFLLFGVLVNHKSYEQIEISLQLKTL